VKCDHRRWGIRDCRKVRHRRRQCVLQIGSGRTIPVVKDAQVGLGGAERADSETALSEYLGVRRRCKGRVYPGAGYTAGLPRDSGRGMPWVTTGQDEVPVREAPTASVLTRSIPTESHRNRRQLCWQCSGTGQLGRERLGGSSWPATK
jgi:hypothetical protein